MSVPGVDHPEEQTEAEIILSGRGISVSSRVESIQGDVVEVFWKYAEGQRALPAEITEVEKGAVVRWRMRATGPAEASQRRRAVRGRVAVPIEAKYVGVDLKCTTVDRSEAGVRANFDGYGIPPESGNTLDLALRLEEGAVRTKAEVVRTQARGAVWLMSIRFTGMEERDQDQVRRRVFQALREERARMADDASGNRR